MSNPGDWLYDQSANRFRGTYTKGFVDISGGNLIVRNGDVSFNNKLFASSDVSFDSTLRVGDTTTLNSLLLVSGDVSMNNKLFVNNDASLNENLSVGGNIAVDNKLTVSGDASMNSKLQVADATILDSTLSVDGDASMNSTLSVGGGGDTEITGSVTFEGEFFTLLWKVPEEKKIEIEYGSNSVIDKATYDLYGYSFEVKDPFKAGWRQFAEYTDDNPAPSGCDDPHWKGFDAQWGDDSDKGEDQTVIRGNQGREYMAGETLNANYLSPKTVTDWVEYNYPEKYIPPGYNLPPGIVLPVSATDLNGPGFLRSYEYEFRVRAIYKVTKVTKTGYESTFKIYTNPEGDGNTGGAGNFAVNTTIVAMGRISRARNANFGSGGGVIFNSEQEDPNNPFAPPEE